MELGRKQNTWTRFKIIFKLIGPFNSMVLIFELLIALTLKPNVFQLLIALILEPNDTQQRDEITKTPWAVKI